jgi:hypothetical protein
MYFFSKKQHEKKNCLICLEPILTETTLPVRFFCKCKPQIHLSCFEDWRNHSLNKCPICLTKLQNKKNFSYLNGFQVILNFVFIIIGINLWYSIFVRMYRDFFYNLDQEL